MSSAESKRTSEPQKPDEPVPTWHLRLVNAAVACDAKQVLALLDENPSAVTTENSEHGDSLLHFVARGLADEKQTDSALQLLTQLIQRGADPSAQNDAGETCLFEAARAGSLPGVKLLLLYLSANEQSNNGTTPLLLACKSGNAELVRYLVDQGADWAAEDEVLHAFQSLRDTLRTGRLRRLCRPLRTGPRWSAQVPARARPSDVHEGETNLPVSCSLSSTFHELRTALALCTPQPRLEGTVVRWLAFSFCSARAANRNHWCVLSDSLSFLTLSCACPHFLQEGITFLMSAAFGGSAPVIQLALSLPEADLKAKVSDLVSDFGSSKCAC
jgi:hypothetical protein